ncbi:hypothetical protein F0562_025470 [Nyssa sinensis]|uniref:Uncharacterized protein n=1 Tax=Nyssa sinensis TaxID=561372 RepID=A0A5J5B825_9ASTE|nr:hypothetical protein F0562_025470 [Nyssa sinensis]
MASSPPGPHQTPICTATPSIQTVQQMQNVHVIPCPPQPQIPSRATTASLSVPYTEQVNQPFTRPHPPTSPGSHHTLVCNIVPTMQAAPAPCKNPRQSTTWPSYMIVNQQKHNASSSDGPQPAPHTSFNPAIAHVSDGPHPSSQPYTDTYTHSLFKPPQQTTMRSDDTAVQLVRAHLENSGKVQSSTGPVKLQSDATAANSLMQANFLQLT